MVLRVALFSLLLLGLAGLGGVAWVALQAPPGAVSEAAAPPPARVMVIAAARPLRAGTFLRTEDLQAREFEATDAPAGAVRDAPGGRAGLAGAMLRRSVGAGAAITAEDVLRPGERGFLAVLLNPGTRAATIGVDAVSGIAGLVWPGDRVDVLLTQQLGDDQSPVQRRVASETVLGGVRVIAIDQAIVQGAVAGEPPEAGRQQIRTVTLEVSPSDAERLAVAGRIGRLSLTVVAAQGEVIPQAANAPATWAGDVSAALRGAEPQAATPAPPPRAVNVHLGSGRREEFRF